MKFVLVLLVVVVGLWLLLRSRGGPKDEGSAGRGTTRRDRSAAEPVVACAHCGVHLPRHDAVLDAADRPFCTEAHRLAGPR